MSIFRKSYRAAGWITFAVAMIVYFFSVERTGSLWDCGEFISAAYKLQVVHPPGAPLFIIMARMFTAVADALFEDPAAIGHAVNLFSGMATAFAAAFVAWTTTLLSKMAVLGRAGKADKVQSITFALSGLAAGLTAAFATSVWFSAVEGEVYALSTFFTAITIWSAVVWYSLPKDPQHDRWLLFAIFVAALSIGVHLLSLLTFPALALFYYYKKFNKQSLGGGIIAMLIGVAMIIIIQKVIIVGIPTLWYGIDLMMVNSLGLPPNSGIIPTVIILAVAIVLGLRYAEKKKKALLEQAILAFMLAIIGYSTIAVVVIRSNANPPINMNDPSDPSRLLPYINREQYGERPLLFGPHYDAQPVKYDRQDRLGLVDGKYEKVSEKITPLYSKKDEMFFPRLGHMDSRRQRLYRIWLDKKKGQDPTFADNIQFFVSYQIGWMYVRYFMWNFVGRQNAEQGFFPWNVKSGHWASGIDFIDDARLYDTSELPPSMEEEESRNHYYFIPFILGIIGLIWQFRTRRKDFFALLGLFIITGLGIIVYSNQPPNEPRERDYVLVGSFMTYAMWIGMAVNALFQLIRERSGLSGIAASIVSGVIVLFAPAIMLSENYDDHSRRWITAARDYATNYLQSLEEDAILFTYGDNDTYPLWYAQEVEGVRPDVRIINLSLIAVDWYIDQMRRKVNESPPIKMTVPQEAIRGDKRNSIGYYSEGKGPNIPIQRFLKFVAEDHPLRGANQQIDTYLPTKQTYIPVNKQEAIASGWVDESLADQIADSIPINISGNYITKDDLAIMDIIASNIPERPIYFASTVQPSKLQGLNDYMQFEGLAMRVVPIHTPSNKSLSIYGSGRVAADRVLENISEHYSWGNFDKYDLFVDESYSAAIQAHRMVMMRSVEKFLGRGEHQKAVQMADHYFEGFPNMNFPFIKHQVTPFINAYIQANEIEKAKEKIDVLATQVEEYMEFYISLEPSKLRSGFEQDFRFAQRTLRETMQMAQQIGGEYGKEITSRLNQYNAQNQQING
jgi:hypothetical protein